MGLGTCHGQFFFDQTPSGSVYRIGATTLHEAGYVLTDNKRPKPVLDSVGDLVELVCTLEVTGIRSGSSRCATGGLVETD